MRKEDVDSMAYRRATHLAGVDVDIMISEGKSTVLTIKKAYYDDDVDVNGKKQNGYFIEFVEDLKPMLVNSGNRKIIASMIRIKKSLSATESRNLKNWVGEKIELYFEENRSFGGVKTGGIGIRPTSPIPNISDANGTKILNASKTLAELKVNWDKLTAQEKSLPTIAALKETLKNKLK